MIGPIRWRTILKSLVLSALLGAAGFAAGLWWSVYSTRPWPRFNDPQGLWVASFPRAPLAEQQPAPVPFSGQMRTWSASTEQGSFQLAMVDGLGLDGSHPDPVWLAAESALLFGRPLELEDGGRFRVATEAGTVYGRVLKDANGRVFRLLAATPVRPSGSPPGVARLFLETIEVRGVGP